MLQLIESYAKDGAFNSKIIWRIRAASQIHISFTGKNGFDFNELIWNLELVEQMKPMVYFYEDSTGYTFMQNQWVILELDKNLWAEDNWV